MLTLKRAILAAGLVASTIGTVVFGVEPVVLVIETVVLAVETEVVKHVHIILHYQRLYL